MEYVEISKVRPFAVVTDASSGIGYELALQFAVNGFDLLIAAKGEGLFEAQEKLQEITDRVEAVQVDLATYKGVEELYSKIITFGKPLEAIAINAGVGIGGEFIKTDLKEEVNLINLNIVSSIHLSKRVLKDMMKNGKGRILFTASIASVTPEPFDAVYGASKAFLLSFAEAIRNEAKDSGVTVTSLLAGAANIGPEMKDENDPADVARQSFEAMMAGREKVFAASLITKLEGWATKIIPDSVKAQYHRILSEPGSVHQ